MGIFRDGKINLKSTKGDTNKGSIVNINNDNQMITILQEINSTVGAVKATSEIILKQLDKMEKVDENIINKQQDLEKRIIRIEYDIDKLQNKIGGSYVRKNKKFV